MRGRTVALVALGFVLACARTQALEWQYCEGAEDHEAEVDFVTMSPDPALAGGEITVHIGGTIGEFQRNRGIGARGEQKGQRHRLTNHFASLSFQSARF